MTDARTDTQHRSGGATEDCRILLLPGLDGSGRLFRHVLEELPSSLAPRVASYPVDRCRSYEDLLDIVRECVPPGVRHVVVAESFSGPAAVRYALARGRDVAGLVLCASFVACPLPWWLRGAVVFAGPFVSRIPPPRFAIRLLMVGSGAPAPLVDEVRSAIRAVQPAVVRDRMRAVLAVNACAELARLEVPVLYLAASRDRLVGRRGLLGVLRARPATQVRTLDAPHLILQVAPEAAAAAILGFLQEVSAAGP